MEVKLIDVSYEKELTNINMDFKQGVNTIIGNNSTILKLIALLKKDKGKVKIDGKVVKSIKDSSKYISFIFEFPESQFFNSTVLEELKCGKKISYDDITKVMDLLELDLKLLDRNPFSLSSGEKRKVAIASILLDDKDVIIFSEPTIGLDSKGKESIIKIIRNLKNIGMTIIIGTCDIEFAHKISDYVYVVSDTVVLEGKKYDVFKNVEVLKELDISIPKVIEFSNYVLNNKKIRLGYRDDINDLIKDIYRYVK